jgi:hemerythrin-like metal-binding protein
MWRESLCIGVNSIDDQHRELFKRTEELLREVQANGVTNKQECVSMILFLKDYAVNHFADEEAYQKLINYKGFAEHKKLHEKFLASVLNHEKKLKESNFAEADVKEFVGTLVAWLLYHVADADQKIAKKSAQSTAISEHDDIISDSICKVLNVLAGIDEDSMLRLLKYSGSFDEPFYIEIMFTGDIGGYITFVYPLSFVKEFVSSMMSYIPEVIDELEISALFEASNIISGTICKHIAATKGIVCDITPPMMTTKPGIQPDEMVIIDTGIGIIEADVSIEYK